MRQYVQSSLRYRPQFFKDVLGQPAAVKILQNSFIYDRLSSSYLFTGQRGTGKTSVARIFSKLLNCDSPNNGEPCGECPSCQNIQFCKDPNVIELDAASHGLKEDIASIQQMATQTPYPGKRKIFILDECHMLTTQAQNSFLKLLEEPPKDIIFIMVTTEDKKLLNTIHSRCFRVDFRSLPLPVIAQSIERIFKDSGILYDERVIKILLNNSEGALRDIQQLSDQLVGIAEEGKTLTEQDASALFGYLSIDQFKEVAALLCTRDFFEWVSGIEELFYAGVDFEYLLNKGLQLLLRDFRCATCCGKDWDYLTGISYESFERNVDFSDVELDILQQALEDAMEQKRTGCSPRLCLEIFYAKFLDEISFQNKR